MDDGGGGGGRKTRGMRMCRMGWRRGRAYSDQALSG